MSKNLAEAIIKKLGKDGMEQLKKNGEFPAIKLTQEEMAFLKGAAGVYTTTAKKGSDLDLASGSMIYDFLQIAKEPKRG